MTSIPSEMPSSNSNPYVAPLGSQKDNVLADIPNISGPHFIAFLFAYFFGNFLFMTLTWTVLWSWWMSLIMRWDFLSTLTNRGLLGGLFFGLLMSILLTGYVAIFTRQNVIELPLAKDVSLVLSDIDSWLSKRRYRRAASTQKRIAYVPKTLIRLRYFFLFVIPGETTLTIVGPGAQVNFLRKKLQENAGS